MACKILEINPNDMSKGLKSGPTSVVPAVEAQTASNDDLVSEQDDANSAVLGEGNHWNEVMDENQSPVKSNSNKTPVRSDCDQNKENLAPNNVHSLARMSNSGVAPIINFNNCNFGGANLFH